MLSHWYLVLPQGLLGIKLKAFFYKQVSSDFPLNALTTRCHRSLSSTLRYPTIKSNPMSGKRRIGSPSLSDTSVGNQS